MGPLVIDGDDASAGGDEVGRFTSLDEVDMAKPIPNLDEDSVGIFDKMLAPDSDAIDGEVSTAAYEEHSFDETATDKVSVE